MPSNNGCMDQLQMNAIATVLIQPFNSLGSTGTVLDQGMMYVK